MDVCSTRSKTEALVHAPAGKNLDNIMLNERSQTWKPTFSKVALAGGVQNWPVQRDRK